jgi:hypothetical protein
MQDTPPIVVDDEKTVKHTERDGRDGEQIYDRNGLR